MFISHHKNLLQTLIFFILSYIQKTIITSKSLHFNILIQAFILVNKGKANLIKIILENCKSLIKHDIYSNLLSSLNSDLSNSEYDIPEFWSQEK